jgi:hypothetical protein
MSTITFDTLKYVKQLENAGIPAVHAEAFVNAQRDILADALDTNIATRGDLATVKTEMTALRTDIELFKKDVEAMEQRLTIKLGAFLAVFAGIIIAALKAF